MSALQYAVLANSSLEGIEFKDAKMNGADLEGADIRGADFAGVDVTTVINLNLAKNYDKAKGLVKPESEPETVTE